MRSALCLILLCLVCVPPAQAQPPPLSVTAIAPAADVEPGGIFTVEIHSEGAARITIAPVAGLQLIESYPEATATTWAYFRVTQTTPGRITIPIVVEDGQGGQVVTTVFVTVGGVRRYALPAVWG